MKILWAKSGGLLPLDSGGRIRSYYIATSWRAGTPDGVHDLLGARAHPHVVPRAVYGHRIVPLDLAERGSVPDMPSYAANALTLKPYQMRKYCGPQVRRNCAEPRAREYDARSCATSCSPPPPSHGTCRSRTSCSRTTSKPPSGGGTSRSAAIPCGGSWRGASTRHGSAPKALHGTGRSRAHGLRRGPQGVHRISAGGQGHDDTDRR